LKTPFRPASGRAAAAAHRSLHRSKNSLPPVAHIDQAQWARAPRNLRGDFAVARPNRDSMGRKITCAFPGDVTVISRERK